MSAQVVSTLWAGGFAGLILLAIVLFKSLRRIGPSDVGVVWLRWSPKQLRDDNPIAFRGEAGYQAGLLMPGLRFKLWPLYAVSNQPWVQIPAGQVGVVIAQIGGPTPIGAKSAQYHTEFGNFTSLETFIQLGGQKGVQRPVLRPGTLVPIHPVAFLVLTRERVAEEKRQTRDAAAGRADRQKDLATSEVGIAIAQNHANARTSEALGEA